MDPATSADKFYAALLKVPGWESMPVTVAAQRVQRSAFPDAYADDEAVARRLLGGSSSGSVAPAGLTAPLGGCASSVGVGGVVFPLPASASYVDQRNYGGHGVHWARFHTGTDLSAACGTPVLAATAGTVIVRTDRGWAGRWLVEVSTGIGRLTTWYAHMRAVTVTSGEQVAGGAADRAGGDLGNATVTCTSRCIPAVGRSTRIRWTRARGWLRMSAGLAPRCSRSVWLGRRGRTGSRWRRSTCWGTPIPRRAATSRGWRRGRRGWPA